MSKADRDRQALLQRLAREQRRALDAAARDADRARTPRAFAGVRAQRERGFLQRQGHVGAGPAARGEGGERGGEIPGLRIDRDIVDVDAGLLAERGMDARRQRMRHRMPEHREMPAHGIPLDGRCPESTPAGVVISVNRAASVPHPARSR